AHLHGRRELDVLVAARSAHVRELLLAGDVHLEIGGMAVLADHHAVVDGHAGAVEERAALLQREERVGHGLAVAHRDDRAALALRDRALPRLPPIRLAGHDALAAGDGEELVAEADEAAGRYAELHAGATGAHGLHVHHPALADAEALGHGADRG